MRRFALSRGLTGKVFQSKVDVVRHHMNGLQFFDGAKRMSDGFVTLMRYDESLHNLPLHGHFLHHVAHVSEQLANSLIRRVPSFEFYH